MLEQLKSGKIKKSSLDVSIESLLKLHETELIEAYVLLAKADDGIAQDYSVYRKVNREKLRKYLIEVVTNGGVTNNGI
ncbi:hypothetical protein L0152_25535 [bacterium]|nr:hypothetical protein [bacterium]